MFVEHNTVNLSTFPADKVVRIHSSCGDIQMTFPGFPPQRCGAHLVALNKDSKLLIVAGFYLSESCETVFFAPDEGAVEFGDLEAAFDDGLQFVESMGFILSETDYHELSETNKQKTWASLSICQTEDQKQAKLAALKEKAARQAEQEQQEQNQADEPAKESQATAQQPAAENNQVQQDSVEREIPRDSLDDYRERNLKSLGRFLASM